jgi:hypothetical protein
MRVQGSMFSVKYWNLFHADQPGGWQVSQITQIDRDSMFKVRGRKLFHADLPAGSVILQYLSNTGVTFSY